MEENKCVCFLAHPARLYLEQTRGLSLPLVSSFRLEPAHMPGVGGCESVTTKSEPDVQQTGEQSCCSCTTAAPLRHRTARGNGHGRAIGCHGPYCVCVRPLSRCVSTESVIPPLAVTIGHGHDNKDAEQRPLCGHSRCPFATAASPAGPTVKR